MHYTCLKCKYEFDVYNNPCIHNSGPSNFIRITCPACMEAMKIEKTCPKCGSKELKSSINMNN